MTIIPSLRVVTGATAIFAFSTLGACLLTTSLDGLAGSGVDAGPAPARDSATREAAADGALDGDAEADGNAVSCVAESSSCGPADVCCRGACFHGLCRLCLGAGASCSGGRSPPGLDDCCSGVRIVGACQ